MTSASGRGRLRSAAASVAWTALIAACLAAVPGCRPVRGNRTNVLLVTYETTRADHLSAYGYGRDTSPALARLASEGVLFTSHLSVSPRTNPSLASLMTSAYPHQHGVRNLLLPLEPENKTLAEVLRGAGYATYAVQTHPRLVRASGLAQGFERYDDDVVTHPLADQACALASKWIETVSRGRRPWFAWVHLMDPHWTYEPPGPWRTRYAPDDPRPWALYDDLRARRATIGPVIFRNAMPPDEVSSFVALYDAELRFTDEALGSLLGAVARTGDAGHTLVIVTADHGESLGEHGYFFEHGDLGSEPEIHIPLVMRLPGAVPGGRRVDATERSIDIAPTILETLGLPAEPSFRGASLLPLILGEDSADRPCFGETDKSFHEENVWRELPGIAGKWRWLRRGHFKLVYVPHAGRSPEWRLYDLSIDPGESADAGSTAPETLDSLRRELSAWMAEDRTPEREYHISSETREQLRSLGYLN